MNDTEGKRMTTDEAQLAYDEAFPGCRAWVDFDDVREDGDVVLDGTFSLEKLRAITDLLSTIKDPK